MHKHILALALIAPILFANPTVNDPHHILEQVDAFLQAPSFENSFKEGQRTILATYSYNHGIIEKDLSYAFHVRTVTPDYMEYTTMIGPMYIHRDKYEKDKGSYLRKKLFWDSGHKTTYDLVSVKKSTFTLNGIVRPALKIRMNTAILYSEWDRYSEELTIIRAQYFSQIAFRKMWREDPQNYFAYLIVREK